MKKKIILSVLAAGVLVAILPLVSAFEAHIINVTAQIEESCLNRIDDIDFGTTFPQERLDKTFDVELSASFLASSEHDELEYNIIQKPKCWDGNLESPVFGEVVEDNGEFICVDDGFEILPVLCPYLSKSEITEDGSETENDSDGIPAFHGLPGIWTPGTSSSTEVMGRLVKSADDIFDTWNIDLKVPCFDEHCAQDWNDYVIGINPEANPDDYIQPIENEGNLFGCDLWLEVTAKPPVEDCFGEIDLMMVLDRSGSISSTELFILKNAANSFVTALAPSADGVHIGQTSFATTGSLDLHLTDDETAVHAAINALSSGGFTNLEDGIELATDELDDAHEHERVLVDDVMVIITDGVPNRPTSAAVAEPAAAAAADAARADGIEVFVVGVGVTASTETYLKDNIADDAAHYFAAADFGDLEDILVGLTECPL